MTASINTAKARQLRIRTGKPEILGNRSGGFPRVQKFSDGTIIVGATMGGHHRVSGPMLMKFYNHVKQGKSLSEETIAKMGFTDMNLGVGHWAIQSTDEGTTWTEVTNDVTRIFAASYLGSIRELSDGTMICVSKFSFVTKEGEEFFIWRSRDKGKSWTGPEFARVSGPAHADTGWQNEHLGGTFYGGIIELDDGTLLLFGHTRFQGDRKLRVVVYCSEDKGKSFRYFSTVAYADNNSSTLRPIGFNEPGVVRLRNGELVCFIRTAEYEPLFQARSKDGGKTWSTPERIGVDGILPRPVLLQNGVLALSYGRPGVWVIFSTDGGHWWTDKKCIWIWHSLWGEGHLPKTKHYSTGGYTGFERSDCNAGLCEIAPNKLLIVYSAPKDSKDTGPIEVSDPKQRAACFIWGVTLDVTY